MSQGPANLNATPIHAVVWRGVGAETPADLIAALARQGIDWEEAIGPFDAFARIAAGRARGSRALLLVEPTGLEGIEEVRRAIERFDPVVACWGYRRDQSPRLARLAPLAKPREPEVVVRPRLGGGPKLRLAGEGSAQRSEQPAVAESRRVEHPEEAPESESPRSILAPEELEMLLADDRE